MTATAVESRPYRGSFDLRGMQQLLVRNASTTPWHVGDLAWAMREHPHLELTLLVRLFFVGDELIGWTWVRGRGLIEIELLAKYRDTVLYDAMIGAGEEIVDAMRRAGDEVGELRAWIPDDDGAMATAFTRRGFAPTDLALQQNQRPSLDEVPEPRALPGGWAFAAVDTDERIASRVECHRAAFAPSILTIEAYRRARACWPYRADLDRVILDDSGAVVAASTAWLDEANGKACWSRWPPAPATSAAAMAAPSVSMRSERCARQGPEAPGWVRRRGAGVRHLRRHRLRAGGPGHGAHQDVAPRLTTPPRGSGDRQPGWPPGQTTPTARAGDGRQRPCAHVWRGGDVAAATVLTRPVARS